MLINNFDLLNSSPADKGITLIDSSAGTGKTFTIASLVPRLLIEGKATCISSILIVTFTNAAADELADRIRKRLKEVLCAFDNGTNDEFLSSLISSGKAGRAKIAEALARIDEAAIYTIHGFCKRILEESAFESGMPLETEFINDESALLRQVALDYWRQIIYPSAGLAGIIAAQKIPPDDIIKSLKPLLSQPNAKMLPEASDIATLLASINSQIEELQRSWNEDGFLQHIQSLPFSTQKAKSGLLLDPELFVKKISSALMNGDLSLLIPLAKNASTPVFQKALLKKGLASYCPHNFSVICEKFSSIITEISLALHQGMLQYIKANLDAQKRRLLTLSFNDLLSLLHKALKMPQHSGELKKAVRGQFDVALIDEFQDTDPLQLEIFTELFATCRPLIFIGDPKQAIYSFRGADIFAYLEAAKHAKERFTLGKNWRSEEGVIAATNALFSTNKQPFILDGIDFIPASAEGKDKSQALYGDEKKSLHWLQVTDTNEVIDSIKNEVLATLTGELKIGSEKIRPQDIAILVRTNYQAEAIQQELKSVGIPAVIGGSGNIFHTPQMLEIEQVLRYILNPRDNAALCGFIWNLCAEDIFHAQENEECWQERYEELRELKSIWEISGTEMMLRSLLMRKEVFARAAKEENGERIITNYRHALEMTSEAPATPEAALNWLSSKLKNDASTEAELRLETDEEAVQIVTIHKSKGLEYKIVFCPFLWDAKKKQNSGAAILHKNNQLYCDFGSTEYEANLAEAENEKLAEQMRLLYVAVTRAVHRVYLTAPDKLLPGSPLNYLLGDKNGILDLVKMHPQIMSISSSATIEGKWEADINNDAPLSAREFTRANDLSCWYTTSFSMLSKSSSHSQQYSQATGDIFGFGRGINAPSAREVGLCLHEIFEIIDFAAPQKDLVENQLTRYSLNDKSAHIGIDSPLDTVMQLIGNTLSHPLPENNFSLSQCTNRSCEMPFMLHLKSLNLHQNLRYLFKGTAYLEYALKLNENKISGFLNGIIDLVFEFEGKWYIIDWKSNYLGAAIEDYSNGKLITAMHEHHYTLQYYLYTAALDKYLSTRLPDFNYERDFGGVYYAWLRGIDGTGSGWFFDRPPPENIAYMNSQIFS